MKVLINIIQKGFSVCKVSKTECGTYRCYDMFVIVDAIGNVHFMATSPYLTDGCITVCGNTLEELKANIDNVHLRIKLISCQRN